MTPEKFNEKLGLRLRELRRLSRLTQDDLAKKTGLSRASIANMETGRQAMSAYQAYEIATALQLKSMDELYELRSGTHDTDADVIFRSPDLEERQARHFTAFMARSVR